MHYHLDRVIVAGLNIHPLEDVNILDIVVV